MYEILCTRFYVWDFMYEILCPTFYVRHFMYEILCKRFYVRDFLSEILWTRFYVRDFMYECHLRWASVWVGVPGKIFINWLIFLTVTQTFTAYLNKPLLLEALGPCIRWKIVLKKGFILHEYLFFFIFQVCSSRFLAFKKIFLSFASFLLDALYSIVSFCSVLNNKSENTRVEHLENNVV